MAPFWLASFVIETIYLLIKRLSKSRIKRSGFLLRLDFIKTSLPDDHFLYAKPRFVHRAEKGDIWIYLRYPVLCNLLRSIKVIMDFLF